MTTSPRQLVHLVSRYVPGLLRSFRSSKTVINPTNQYAPINVAPYSHPEITVSLDNVQMYDAQNTVPLCPLDGEISPVSEKETDRICIGYHNLATHNLPVHSPSIISPNTNDTRPKSSRSAPVAVRRLKKSSKTESGKKETLINVYYQNMNSVKGVERQKTVYLSSLESDYDVYAFTETYLDSSISDEMLFSSCFSV